MKQIYVYNNKNVNEFLFTKQVQDSYVTLPPATEIQPPPKDEGYVWLFDQDLQQWNGQIVDYRGQIVYNKRDSLISKKVSFVGEIGDGYTLVAPPDFQNSYRFNGESGSWQLATVGGIGEESDPIYTADKSKYALKSELFSLDSALGDFATTISETTFSTEYIWNVTESSYVSDLLLEIMTRFDADEKANSIRHQEFETRLTTLEENTSSGTSNITVNNISPDENGNIVLTSDQIISNYSGNGVSITQQLQYFQESIEQQLKNENYVKTVNGNSPDDYGDVQLDLNFVTSVNGQTGQVTGIVQTVDSLTPDENGNIDS